MDRGISVLVNGVEIKAELNRGIQESSRALSVTADVFSVNACLVIMALSTAESCRYTVPEKILIQPYENRNLWPFSFSPKVQV